MRVITYVWSQKHPTFILCGIRGVSWASDWNLECRQCQAFLIAIFFHFGTGVRHSKFQSGAILIYCIEIYLQYTSISIFAHTHHIFQCFETLPHDTILYHIIIIPYVSISPCYTLYHRCHRDPLAYLRRGPVVIVYGCLERIPEALQSLTRMCMYICTHMHVYKRGRQTDG